MKDENHLDDNYHNDYNFISLNNDDEITFFVLSATTKFRKKRRHSLSNFVATFKTQKKQKIDNSFKSSTIKPLFNKKSKQKSRRLIRFSFENFKFKKFFSLEALELVTSQEIIATLLQKYDFS